MIGFSRFLNNLAGVKMRTQKTIACSIKAHEILTQIFLEVIVLINFNSMIFMCVAEMEKKNKKIAQSARDMIMENLNRE